MLLEGHEGEVFSCEFHPEGEHLLSTGFDRKIRKCASLIDHQMSVFVVTPCIPS